MPKYNYIFCNNCERFYFDWSVDFGDSNKSCPLCFTKNIIEYTSESFSEMAQIERIYKLNKILINNN